MNPYEINKKKAEHDDKWIKGHQEFLATQAKLKVFNRLVRSMTFIRGKQLEFDFVLQELPYV